MVNSNNVASALGVGIDVCDSLRLAKMVVFTSSLIFSRRRSSAYQNCERVDENSKLVNSNNLQNSHFHSFC